MPDSCDLVIDLGEAATRSLNSEPWLPVKGVRFSPSFGRRCPEGAEVGCVKRYFHRGDANPASLRSSAPSRGRGENDS